MSRSPAAWFLALAATACPAGPPAGGAASGRPPAASAPLDAPSVAVPAPSTSAADTRDAPDAAAQASDAGGVEAALSVSFDDAFEALFVREAKPGQATLDPGTSARAACAPLLERRVECLLEKRYDADETARAAALALFAQSGSVAGLEREHLMDGGFRGVIRLVPELPIGRWAKHLVWVAEAAKDHADFLATLASRGGAQPSFRIRGITYRFFRSVGRTTPSAYASGWTVAYNVAGSLHASADAVRETLFHEIFHLNDAARSGFARARLGKDFDAIVAECGTKMSCLARYAPGTTTVRGGTYYAFQPDNGDAVNEYAAELAVRYYREHRALLRGERVAAPFKCGPAVNARVWKALAGELFGGIDLVPPCGSR